MSLIRIEVVCHRDTRVYSLDYTALRTNQINYQLLLDERDETLLEKHLVQYS